MWFRSAEPEGYWIDWESPTYNVELSYRSPQFSAPDRTSEDIRPTFEYQVAAGSSRGYVVRIGYPGADWPESSRRFALREAIEKSRQFHAAARAAITDWPLRRANELVARAEEQKRADDLAAYDRYLAGQRRLVETFKASLKRITDQSIAEVKQGRASTLDPWLTALAKLEGVTLPPGQRDRAIASSQGQVQSALDSERNRVQYEIDSERRRVEASLQEAQAAALQRKLAGPIPLAVTNAGIVFGTRIRDGSDFIVPVRQMRHSLIAGVAGAGKSVLLKGLIFQLIRSPEVERLILIDLKEGVSFFKFKDSPKCELIYELPDVMRVIAGLMPVMVERFRSMRNDGVELYRGGRTFVIIDEYTEIQSAIDRSDKRSPLRELADNLENLSRRARAAGIVILCSLQKPTLDGISAAIRNNMDCRLVLRTATNQLAASMLEELDDLSVKPTQLPDGRYYYFDASRGIRRLLQAHVAPGVDLGNNS
jgi:hypothetical protein